MPGASITTSGGFVNLTFEIEGYERLSVGLSRFVQQIQDFRPFFRNELAPWFFARIVENFQQQGAPVGGWKPLSPRYAAWKAKHYPGKTILRRSDDLIKSLTMAGGALGVGGRLGAGGILNVSPHSAELGTSVPYARYHQHGAPKRQLPQRRILYLPPDASRTMGKLLQRWAVQLLRSNVTSTSTPTMVAAGPGGGLL